MQQHGPNHGDEGEPRLRRVRIGEEGSPGDGSYGGESGSGTSPTSSPSAASAADEQTWSVLAHLSILLSLITGIGGFVAALVIWLVYRDRSDRVTFHALQSFWYQVAWAVILFAYTVLSLILTVVLIGIPMLFLIPLIALIPLAHQCYAAYKVNGGVDYRYPLVADMIDREHRFG